MERVNLTFKMLVVYISYDLFGVMVGLDISKEIRKKHIKFYLTNIYKYFSCQLVLNFL